MVLCKTSNKSRDYEFKAFSFKFITMNEREYLPTEFVHDLIREIKTRGAS